MTPDSYLVWAVMGAVTIVVFGIIHKWQARDFKRGYDVALDHVEFDLSRQYVNGLEPSVRGAVKDALEVVRKLRKENERG